MNCRGEARSPKPLCILGEATPGRARQSRLRAGPCHLRMCPLCCVYGAPGRVWTESPRLCPVLRTGGNLGLHDQTLFEHVCPEGPKKDARGFAEDRERQLVWLTRKTNRAV